MGIQFKNIDLKKDEFIEIEERNRRKIERKKKQAGEECQIACFKT